MKAEEYRERRDALEGWPVAIVSYRLGDRYVCAVHNVDPGARIAMAEAPTREEAEARAVEDARRRLARTRRG
ncbi:MAG TPA: hypothetical protein VNK92_07610 [Vicinamibacterales bacterium]|jgi:hypothetical protein|nr:hypothetical protein [Vicinamibacterales bacterium]